MGSIQAMGFAAEVQEGHVSLETALSWHLTTNHYPPVPAAMVPVCVAAILAAELGDYTDLIELPVGTTWRGETSAPAWAICEGHHLDAFVNQILEG